jgi:hypothetical protein
MAGQEDLSPHPSSPRHGCESKAPFPSGSSFFPLDSSLPEDIPDFITVAVAAPVPSAVLTRYLVFPDFSEGGRKGFWLLPPQSLDPDWSG